MQRVTTRPTFSRVRLLEALVCSKRRSKGGFEDRVVRALGPAGVRRDDIKWSGRKALVTCFPAKAAQVHNIISQIKNRKVTFEVSATKGVSRPGIMPTTSAAGTASAA